MNRPAKSNVPAPAGRVTSFTRIPDAVTLVIGPYLRGLREARSVSLQKAAGVLGCHLAKISRLETGITPQRTEDVLALMRYYGVHDPEQTEEIRRLFAGNRHRVPDCAPGWAARLAACESAATAIRTYTPWTLPPILQTPAYAQALRRTLAPLIDESTEPAPFSRTLPPDHDKAVTVALDATLLARPTGSACVMAAQLAHLLAMIEHGHVQIRIVPLDRLVALPPNGNLSELTLHGPLYVEESAMSAVYATGPVTRSKHLPLLDTVFDAAESTDRSADLIRQAQHRFAQEEPAHPAHFAETLPPSKDRPDRVGEPRLPPR
ncbi:helix-turn-helix domain-containing protein [Streptomyces sp. NPDC057654]|uniref:helix-turn-helix domain-containing protein n=1 Tax=Streptomyces sp. NPDC057654 TaxID=3346196 RepID=UPI003688D780